MINFNSGSTASFAQLTQIPKSAILPDVSGLLVNDEQVLSVFKTVRDQLIFTSKRIISVDVQGISGRKKSFASLPYSKIQFFSIQTPGLLEIVPNSELFISFADGFTASFSFAGEVNIGKIGRLISEYIL